MDSVRYDIYFTGKLVEGHTSLQAQQQFAQLFKMTPEKVDSYFTGQPQLLKRNIDKAQALKYKQALHKAGMLTAFKAHQEQASLEPSTETAPKPTQAAVVSTAASNPSAVTQTESVQPIQPETKLTIAPTGSDVLNDNERRQPEHRDIDTSAIKLVSPFLDPEPINQEPINQQQAPDTSHLTIAASGVDLLEGHHSEWVELDLDLSALELAPTGTLLEQSNEEKPEINNPDISQISVAEPGADLLENQPKKITPPAPNTDHLSIEP